MTPSSNEASPQTPKPASVAVESENSAQTPSIRIPQTAGSRQPSEGRRSGSGKTPVARTCLAVLALALLALPAPAARKSAGARDVDILELSPEMAKFLVHRVSPRQSPEAQVYALVDAVFGKKGLDITYESTATRTAVETFKERDGNCLSFTILFVAMARHLGLDAYFEEVDEVISWDRRGEVVVRNLHMVVEVEYDNGYQLVDFLPEAEKRYRSVKRISDMRALAHYHNNLGVDALASGDVDQALRYFSDSLVADRKFGYAWTNLGVAQRRAGDFEAAEQSHLRALEIDRNEPAALANLASLYLAQGFADKAAPLQRQVDNHLDRNPFHHYRQGVASARDGDFRTAIRELREAARRMPGEAEFHAALGDALARSGETEKARKSLEKALDLAGDAEEKARLKTELSALGSPK